MTMPETYSQLTRTHKILIVILGFTLVSGLILTLKNVAINHNYEQAKIYNTAIQAVTTDQFNYALDSHQGFILTTTEFTTPNPVSHPEVKDKYFEITKIKERYTRHIEYYECGTEEHPQTCSRTYYTWDYYSSETITAETIKFHDREYPSSIFYPPPSKTLTCAGILNNTCTNGHIYESDSWWNNVGDIRYYFKVIEQNIYGTIFINASEGTPQPVDSNRITIKNKSIEEIIASANSTTGITVFVYVMLLLNTITMIILIRNIVNNEL